MKKIRFSILSFLAVLVSSIVIAPLFGNFTVERLPGLLIVACVIGGIWAIVAGTFLRIR